MIELQKATIVDCDAILEIARNTFAETFLEHNKPENLEAYLKDNINRDKIAAELENQSSFFYLAKIDQQNVGYLKLNFGNAQTELQDKDAVEIERIYVLNAFQNQKVGQIFMDKTVQIATKMTLRYIFLGVWEHNLKAIQFYKKNSFAIFDNHFFTIGNDVQTDFLMKKML